MLWVQPWHLVRHLFSMRLLSKEIKKQYLGAGGLFGAGMMSALRSSLLGYGGWGLATTAATGVSTATGLVTNFLNIANSAQQASLPVVVNTPVD